MTATDELRRLLDEHGVEWESKDVEGVSDFHDTRWNAHDVQWCYVEFVGNNYTKLKPSSEFHCTPEQAIAVTLGGVDGKSRAERTCHIEWCDDSYDTDAGYERDGAYFCTACRAELPYSLQECWDDYQASHFDKPFNYCPNCGCKVVD